MMILGQKARSYWIDPQDNLIDVTETDHWDYAADNPKEFKLTKKETQQIRSNKLSDSEYEKIVKKVFGQGWIRVNLYGNELNF